MSDFPTELFINGELRPSKSRKTTPQINPGTEEQFCAVAAATLEDLEAAVQGAQQAFVNGMVKGADFVKMHLLDRHLMNGRLGLRQALEQRLGAIASGRRQRGAIDQREDLR